MGGSKPFRILCIDGGGIRGLIPAIWLCKLEERLAKRNTSLSRSFNLICGTSTGSIVAAAVATNTDLKRVIDLFRAEGPKIFKRSWKPGRGLLTSRYGAENLEAALKAVLGNTRLRDIPRHTHLCIPAYDIGNRRTFFFQSYDPDTSGNELWKACLASSSAPTYFPTQKFALATGDERYLIDGGVSANNPSGIGLAEGIALLRKKSLKDSEEARDIQLISMGTGSSTRNLSRKVVGSKGGLYWMNAILDVMFDGSSDVSDYVAEQILDSKSYVRLQFDLNAGFGSDDLDDASPHNLQELQSAANDYVEDDGKARFQEIVSLLMPPRRTPAGPRLAAVS
ncbi:MAG: patatin-like phospholipase family protein [Sphingomicrobium sp.]|nr:patatin-like phospholipase family protein [Sphingomonadales bacterium]